MPQETKDFTPQNFETSFGKKSAYYTPVNTVLMEKNFGIYRNWKLSWVNSTFHSQLQRLALLLMSISASKSRYLIINCSLIVVISVVINHHEPVFFFSFLPNAPIFNGSNSREKNRYQERACDYSFLRQHVSGSFHYFQALEK